MLVAWMEGWGMKCINEWRGTAGLIPTKPPRAFHGPHGERVKAAGAAPCASAFERRGADVRAAETNTSALLPAENTNYSCPLMFAHPA